MNLIKRIFLANLLLFCCFSAIQGQTAQTAKKAKEPSHIGWGVNIGNIRFYNNFFQFGLAPNVAYRLSDPLAIGFMLKVDYFYERYNNYPQPDLKFSTFDFGPTIFTRWKPLWKSDNATPFLQGLFVQAEYEKAFIRRAVDKTGTIHYVGDKIIPVKTQEDYLYLGIGAQADIPLVLFSPFIIMSLTTSI
jgi:hypothetical protein